MIIFPAVDIKEGKVVRLAQGKFNEVTEYGNDPVAVAKKWKSLGAEWLHVVDLDRAAGKKDNFEIVKKIAQEVDIRIQLGGGIRSSALITRFLNLDASNYIDPPKKFIDRIVLGSSVIENRDFEEANVDFYKFLKEEILPKRPDDVAVSIDCLNGYVSSRGWTIPTKTKGLDLAKKLETIGVRRLIYTDISRDGMLAGPNLDELKRILKTVRVSVIASGGISSIEDIKKLLKLKKTYKNLEGVITGKALYEGTLDLKEALKVC